MSRNEQESRFTAPVIIKARIASISDIGRSDPMEKVITISPSFEESEQADKEYYHSLSPHERLKILLELNRRRPMKNDAEPTRRLERVYRVIKRA